MKFGKKQGSLTVGIDCGTESLKMVCLEKEEKAYRLVAHGLWMLSNDFDFSRVAPLPTMKQASWRVNIEDPSLKIRRVRVPVVPEDERLAVISWSLNEVLKAPMDQFQIRYKPLSIETDPHWQSYLAFVIEKSAVERRLAELKRLGIKSVDIMEPAVPALARILLQNLSFETEEAVALIDFGNQSSLFLLADRNGLLFSRPLSGITGQSLTRQISRDLAIREEEAEVLKRNYRCSTPEGQAPAKLKFSITNFLSRLSLEIQRSLDASLSQIGSDKVLRIYLSGGGALLDGLQSYLEETLKVPTERLDPFHRINTKLFDNTDQWELRRHFLGLALGLAVDN